MNRYLTNCLLGCIFLMTACTTTQNVTQSVQENIQTMTAPRITSRFLETVRSNEAMLTTFFYQMPKGADLHHHFTGSVYAETYTDNLEAENGWVNTETLIVSLEEPEEISDNWKNVETLKAERRWGEIEEQLIQLWSVKDFHHHSPSDQHFFDSFGYFGEAEDESTLTDGLIELKNRAKKENVSYLETMFKSIKGIPKYPDSKTTDAQLWEHQSSRNEKEVAQIFENLYDFFTKEGAVKAAEDHNAKILARQEKMGLVDDEVTIRYKNFVKRFRSPTRLFSDILTAYISAEKSPWIVGVNIVAPENGETSMDDYWLHMQMFKFCEEKYPNVHNALHAGELILGMVLPEELGWHISEAVYTAKAERIGHGVDVVYEQDCFQLLDYMHDNDVAVEINLTSNDFILNVTKDEHPVSLYHYFDVPIVLSTDDAGILRDNLTRQYVLLARDYAQFSYSDIKKIAFNSIEYSFLSDQDKERLKTDLEQRFEVFENKIAATVKKHGLPK